MIKQLKKRWKYRNRIAEFKKDLILELVMTFGKTNQEAYDLIAKYKVEQELARFPIMLHSDVTSWAVALLSNEGDTEAVLKHYDL